MTGINGDYYLNTTTGNVFQKVSETWVLVGNIKGPIGSGLYISHVEPTSPYAGMIWVQANTIYLRNDSNNSWYQIYPIQLTSKVRAYNSTVNQSITNSQWYKIVFPSKEFDVLNEFDNVTNSRFTAKTAGYYLVTASVISTSTSSSAWLYASIWRNGVAHSSYSIQIARPPIIITDIIYLAVGDYIELYAKSGNSTNLVLQLGQTIFWMSISRML